MEGKIVSQTLKSIISKCYAPGSKRRQRNYCDERLKYEPIARKECQKKAIELNEEYCIIQDNDILQLDNNNFKDMQEFLINNNDYGAISIGGRTKDHNKILNHIGISCVMFRLDCLKKIEFINSTKRSCMCEDVTKSIRDLGYKFNFLDNKIRVFEEYNG